MKIKRFTKLALAGVGLAATAATLTTSTYAWYVTNSKVEATGVQGEVSDEGAGSLYIAKNNYDDTLGDQHAENYGTKIALEAAEWDDTNAKWDSDDLAEGKYIADKLLPQTKATSLIAGNYNLANLMKDYDTDESTMTNEEKAQAKYEYARDRYNETLVSNTYFTDTALTVKATGAYNAATVLYAANDHSDKNALTTYTASAEYTSLSEEDKATALADFKSKHPYWEDNTAYMQVSGTGVADVHKILPSDYNDATLVSNRYHTATEKTSGFATGEYDANALYFDGEDLIEVGDWVDANGYKVDDTSINFKFWLKSGADTEVTQILKVDNISELGIPGQILTTLTGTDASTYEVGSPVLADAAKALRMSVSIAGDLTQIENNATIFNGTGTAEEIAAKNEAIYDKLVAQGVLYVDNNSAWELAKNVGASDYDSSKKYAIREFTTNTYQLVNVAMNKTGLVGYQSSTSTAMAENGLDFDNGALEDANKYYFALMNDVPTNTGTKGASTDENSTSDANGTAFATAAAEKEAFTTFDLKANEDTLVVYKIWLEGSDKDCWDSCKGQQFEFNFEFRAE